MLRLLSVVLLPIVAFWIITLPCAVAQEATLARLPLDEALERIRAEHHMPGIAAAAFHRGKLVVQAAAGIRAEGSPARVTIADRWHLGSCTKSMTATLAALLVEDGKLRWETTVAEALPDLKMDAGWRGATLEQLLQHRGGLPGKPLDALWSAAWKQKGTPGAQRLAFVTGLLAEKSAHVPGAQFEYSNQGYALAGVMMERAAGRSWEELMRERLFAPLGMRSAGFGAPGGDQPRGHTGKAGKLKAVPLGPGDDNPPAIGPAGTVHASIGDWARYAAWHAAGGRDTALKLSAENFARLHRPGPSQTYALGWETTKRGWADGMALTHTGSNTMWFALVWVAPEKEAAFVAVTNAAHDEAFPACDAAVSWLVQRILAAP